MSGCPHRNQSQPSPHPEDSSTQLGGTDPDDDDYDIVSPLYAPRSPSTTKPPAPPLTPDTFNDKQLEDYIIISPVDPTPDYVIIQGPRRPLVKQESQDTPKVTDGSGQAAQTQQPYGSGMSKLEETPRYKAYIARAREREDHTTAPTVEEVRAAEAMPTTNAKKGPHAPEPVNRGGAAAKLQAGNPCEAVSGAEIVEHTAAPILSRRAMKFKRKKETQPNQAEQLIENPKIAQFLKLQYEKTLRDAGVLEEDVLYRMDPSIQGHEGALTPVERSLADPNKKPIQSGSVGRHLYVSNLAFKATEADLRDLFQGYDVRSVNHADKCPYAFVKMSTNGEAERAIVELNGKEFLGRKVVIEMSEHRWETWKGV